MKRDSLTQWHLRRHPEKISRFDKVVIWSGEHKLYWRSNCRGYTDDILEAGVYDARDALANTIHCDPSKKIVLIKCPDNIKTHVGNSTEHHNKKFPYGDGGTKEE